MDLAVGDHYIRDAGSARRVFQVKLFATGRETREKIKSPSSTVEIIRAGPILRLWLKLRWEIKLERWVLWFSGMRR
jgi:hypothetical protein